MPASDRPFRFGVVFTGGTDRAGWTDLARRLEDHGVDTLLVADHYMNPMACGPLIMAAAAVTTQLRVGSYVYNNDFRHPPLLAKEAATIDVLSGGRLELGVGAGWAKPEYQQAGIHFDEPRVRADRFEEAVGVIRRLLAGEQVEHRGEHYRLRGLAGEPRPVQQPVPLLIGGGGPRMLRFAGREADIVGFVPPALPGGGLDPSGYSEASMDRRVRWVDEGVAASGRADGGPERSVLLFRIAASVDEVDDGDDGEIPDDALAASPHALFGDVDAMVDTLHERRDRWGLTYHVCFERDLDRLLPVVDRLARRSSSPPVA